MPKFYGAVGYAKTVETSPGVSVEQITERNYYGDVIRNTRRLQSADKVNDDINISNEISIVADPYANDHFYAIRYVVFQGAKWKVSNVDVQYPRLILSLGVLYNVQEN
mgnify:FL=1